MLSYIETKQLIELVMTSPEKKARKYLHLQLIKMKSEEGEFYTSIAKHAPSMKLTSEQWFMILCRLPNRILRSQIEVENILSETQISQLPPVTG